MGYGYLVKKGGEPSFLKDGLTKLSSKSITVPIGGGEVSCDIESDTILIVLVRDSKYIQLVVSKYGTILAGNYTSSVTYNARFSDGKLYISHRVTSQANEGLTLYQYG